MARAIIGFIVGYITLAAVVFLIFTGAYFAMGADRAFMPGSFEPSLVWNILSFVVAIVASLAGGFVCALIAKGQRTVIVLAIVTALLGCAEGAYYMKNPKPDPGPRTAEVNNIDAMMKAQTPAWMFFANAAVVLVLLPLGGKLRKAPKVS